MNKHSTLLALRLAPLSPGRSLADSLTPTTDPNTHLQVSKRRVRTRMVGTDGTETTNETAAAGVGADAVGVAVSYNWRGG
ncbi:hypothetical protein Q7P37_004332 [Cladosporium fusiforme]